MALVWVGRIGRAHGLRGEVTLDACPLSVPELQAVKSFTWRGSKGETSPLTLETVRPATPRLLLSFAGYRDRARASTLTRGDLLAESERLPDPGPDVAYTFQLIGLEVRTEDGRSLGNVADVIATGAHPVYVVRGARELLIPAAPGVLKKVDPAGGVSIVSLPAGLEELE